MKKYYTEGAALQVIRDLVTVAQGRLNNLDIPHGFIAEHPWTSIYLGPYAEGDDFLKLVNDTSVAIYIIPMHNAERAYRVEREMRHVFRVSVKVSDKSPLSRREQTFKFERQSDGTYCCMNS